MAYYRVGDIIRLTRKSQGLCQEELAFRAGVATETISRIESGKHKVTQVTYKRIMESLNRFSERSYAVCSGKDVGILEEKKLLEDASVKFEQKKVQEYISDLKRKINDDKFNQQYIIRSEIMFEYQNEQVDGKTAIFKLEEALKLTVEDYTQYLEQNSSEESKKTYPFSEQEILILINLAGIYDEMGQGEKAKTIFFMLLHSIRSSYIEGEAEKRIELLIKRGLARVLEGMGKYQEALILHKEILKESVDIGYGLMISLVTYDISWNMEKINMSKGVFVYDLEDIIKKNRQAYFFAKARNDNYIAELAKNSYDKLLSEFSNSRNIEI